MAAKTHCTIEKEERIHTLFPKQITSWLDLTLLYTLHPQYQYNLSRPRLQAQLLYQNNFKLKNKMKINMKSQKRQAHKQPVPYKFNTKQLTQQRNYPNIQTNAKRRGEVENL